MRWEPHSRNDREKASNALDPSWLHSWTGLRLGCLNPTFARDFSLKKLKLLSHLRHYFFSFVTDSNMQFWSQERQKVITKLQCKRTIVMKKSFFFFPINRKGRCCRCPALCEREFCSQLSLTLIALLSEGFVWLDTSEFCRQEVLEKHRKMTLWVSGLDGPEKLTLALDLTRTVGKRIEKKQTHQDS